ncbi:MAG: hypothetical protein H0X31_01735 [Nostocaceae cyanobacterium]|nr:hypothetical protein [Nostocaceae cyanobacterium]
MDFRLFRGLKTEQIAAYFSERDGDSDPDQIEPKYQCKMQPSPNQRENGTLQKGVFVGKSNKSFTEYSDHGDNLHLLVRCRSVWATKNDFPLQRYAVAVTIEHMNGMIELYNLVKQEIQIRERIRVKA